jgi:hypothetical protein
MKISKTKLHQIIKEELQSVLSEVENEYGWGDTRFAPRPAQDRERAASSTPTKKTAAADIEQRQKSDAAEVAKDPILNGRKLRRLFFRNKEWGKQARKALKAAAAETTWRPEFQEAMNSPVPMEPKTTQEKYMLASHRLDWLERRYQKMKRSNPRFDDTKRKVEREELDLEKIAAVVQPYHNIVDLDMQLEKGGQYFIDIANDMIQELGREKMESLVVNPPLLRSFFEKFEASRVDPAKKRFASGEFPR